MLVLDVLDDEVCSLEVLCADLAFVLLPCFNFLAFVAAKLLDVLSDEFLSWICPCPCFGGKSLQSSRDIFLEELERARPLLLWTDLILRGWLYTLRDYLFQFCLKLKVLYELVILRVLPFVSFLSFHCHILSLFFSLRLFVNFAQYLSELFLRYGLMASDVLRPAAGG